MSDNPNSASLPVVSREPESRESPLVLIAGNPNAGKTSLFNALSGLRAKTANYSGVTVDVRRANVPLEIPCAQGSPKRGIELVDLPGQYSLEPTSPEEAVSTDALRGGRLGEPDAVVVVVDSTNMTRNLALATEILELQIPALVVLSLMDAAESSGLSIDHSKLATQLGCPVVPLSVKTGQGLSEIREALAELLSPETTFTPREMPACAVGCSGCSYAQRFEQSDQLVRESVSGTVISYINFLLACHINWLLSLFFMMYDI